VNRLQVAWTYDSADARQGSQIQANPLVVGETIYTTTPSLLVVAIHAVTGKEIWRHDPLQGKRAGHPNRGVSYWTDGRVARVLVTVGTDLLSLDAATGVPDAAFGSGGRVELRDAFDRPRQEVQLSVTTPGVIYRDLIILGSSVPEALPSTPGDIRAYHVRTGKLAWIFHTIPRPGEFGHETWPKDAWKHTGGANNWAGMAVDDARGLVFVPTGSAAFDFYGPDRHGDNLFANTLLCLDAATGKRKWHFQAIRHDLWDLDFPQPPVLGTVTRDGKRIDVVMQAGKDGLLFVFDRETGESLFPLEERRVPASTVDGELAATHQKFPGKPAPFTRQRFGEDTVTRRTEAARQAVLNQLKSLDYGDRFTPPSLRGTVMYPGFSGGAEWGGSAFDPETGIFYVNANEIPWIARLTPAPQKTQRVSKASALYRTQCAACHRADQKGAPPEYPAVNNLKGRLTAEQLDRLIREGAGRMPGFARLGEPAIQAITRFLLEGEDTEAPVGQPARSAVPELKYRFAGYQKFEDPDGYPASLPPWGTLTAIDIASGNHLWQVPLGEYPELVAQGHGATGSENHGGGVVTAGGLFFIGATPFDKKLRAFDKKTGKLLWETVLPFAANASLSMYEARGKQYLLVPAGGGRGRESGSLYIAFTLP
jgi:quinoprotein glucose dehydrogenase